VVRGQKGSGSPRIACLSLEGKTKSPIKGLGFEGADLKVLGIGLKVEMVFRYLDRLFEQDEGVGAPEFGTKEFSG
jgi:hypothetical protein